MNYLSKVNSIEECLKIMSNLRRKTMDTKSKFKEYLTQYCDVKPGDMTDEMRFLEDLGLSSFDFMSLLGDLEDNFDLELDPETIGNVTTIGEALSLIEKTAKTA